MNQTQDFEELDWSENPANIGFGSDAAVVGDEDELDLELGMGYTYIYWHFNYYCYFIPFKDRSPLSAFRPIISNPVRYSASGPDRTSTPLVECETDSGESVAGKTVNTDVELGGGKVLNVPTAVPIATDIGIAAGESGAGKTVNTNESDAGKTEGFQANLGNILARVKGADGPPFNPFKWCLADTPPPFKLVPATFVPNPELLKHVARKKHLDSGDFNMYRFTNMRDGY